MQKIKKQAKKIFNVWFFSNNINVELNQNGKIYKIFYTEDLEMLLKIGEIDSFRLNL